MAACPRLAALGLIASTLLTPSTAQWLPVPAIGSPGPRSFFTLTPWQNGELLLFGGDVTNPAATEWAWNGLRWTPVVTPVPRRQLHAMARNGDTGEIVLFGGSNGTAGLNDTWVWNAGTWTQVVSPVTPPAMGLLRMAWDPRDGSMVLVGVVPAAGPQTWRFANNAWTQLNSFNLVGTFDLFTDSVRREVCMFLSGNLDVQVHRLVGNDWFGVATLAGLSPHCRSTFDTDRGRAVARGVSNTTWFTYEYDGVNIVRTEGGTFAGTVLPQFALAFHAERHETIFVDAPPTSVSRLVGQAVPMATAYDASCVSPAFQLGLLPGDSPQPGTLHRLRAGGSNTSALTLSVLGLSHVQFGALSLPLTIPLGQLGCQLRVEALQIDFVGVGLPAQRVVSVPNTSSLLGARYDAQFLQLDATGITDASNGLEVQIGLPLAEHVLLESFASSQRRDARASGDAWGNGVATPVAIGGDGRHGSFDAALGTALGGGVYEWNTDHTTIPASVSLTGSAEVVTDGRFYFTDFVVPAGITVHFVGSVPAQLFVRGQVDVQGEVRVDAAAMPFFVPATGPLAGQRVSTFDARGGLLAMQGQPGGSGGAGGGRGGNGGWECLGLGPIVLGGVNATDGQPGQDVRVAAGHAYSATTIGTGGAGSPMNPPSGLTAAAGAPWIFATVPYRDEFSPGGGGGGFLVPGGVPAVPVIPPYVGNPSPSQPSNGAAPAASAAFGLLPFPSNPPSGYQSLQHFLVGGSGGGGGGSHTFAIATLPASSEVFMAGHGGSGGGGAVALRAGGDVTIPGTLSARGGAGVVIHGDNPALAAADVNFGVSSPGGGGSGGSVVVQSARSVTVNGTIDTSGGPGSRTSNVSVLALAPFQLNVLAQAGAGSHGFYRLEAGNGVTFAGSGVPAYSAATNSGALSDQDQRTGSRSLWMQPATAVLPYYLRYELVVDVAGQTLLYSDDPAVSSLAANSPNGAVQLRFQGAQLDPVTGAPVAGSPGPWRSSLRPGDDSVNRDRATLLRFDLVIAKSLGAVQVRELRIVWR